MSTGRTLMRLGTRAAALTVVVRQIRQAGRDGDRLRQFDAVVHALAVLTAVLIAIREIRERSGDKAEAVEESRI